MDDKQIIDLYWNRSEDAVKETILKYGGYCHTIAYNILQDHQDSEECVNDTYMQAWKSIPPARPDCLRAYLGKITRNLSLNKCKYLMAQKRGGSQIFVALEEIQECLCSPEGVEPAIDRQHFTETINTFLGSLSKDICKKILVCELN